MSGQGAAPSANTWRRLRVASVVAETHDSKSLVFSISSDQAEAFRYRPGQFLTLRLPVGGRVVRRCYSMSSAPSLDPAPRVTIKRVERGVGSNWICDVAQAGMEIEVLPPAGVFTPRSLQGDFLLFAGGSGITPVLSILRSALAEGVGRILLVYANRDERSVIFKKELNALAAAHPQRLMVIHWLDSVQGVPSLTQLAQLAHMAQVQSDAEAFICGPGPFMDACVLALEGMGMNAQRIHVERFASLPDEDAGADRGTDTAGVEAPEEATVDISHQGQVHRVTVRAQQTILDAALKAGIELPHSCQAGLCASCMCQVLEGKVHLRQNDALDQRDLSRGWTLACQAVPLTAQVRVKFAE